MKFPIERIRALSSHLTIPSRELGRIKLTKLYGTAEYVLQEVTRGFEDGIHDFTILKGGRQIAGTTTADVISLFWPMEFPGMVGQFISDDEANRNYRRDVIVQMLDDLVRDPECPP